MAEALRGLCEEIDAARRGHAELALERQVLLAQARESAAVLERQRQDAQAAYSRLQEEAARDREASEAAKRTQLNAGELGLDLYHMRGRLADRGVRYVEFPESP